MAQPIIFTPARRDPREELFHQLERAPKEHIEALLDAYAILQLLRDKGLLEMAKGVLGSGEKILGILTETMEADEVVRTVRNLVIFLKLIGSIEPETLETMAHTLSQSIETNKKKKPPGMFKLLAGLAKPSARRVLAPAVASIQAVGENLTHQKSGKEKRTKTTRHSA